jgi:glutamyl-tRNA reductase
MTRPGVLDSTGSELLLAVSVSHRTVPLAFFEQLALSASSRARMLAETSGHDAIREAVVLSTCNRTELYLVVTDPVEAERFVLASLSKQAGIRSSALRGRLQSFRGIEAVRHLFLVTAGLESMVVGETEIQGQVKRAYKRALLDGVTGPVTNRLFRGALEAGKRARNETASCISRPSIASVAVGVAARRLGKLEGCRALVIGAGENAALTGRALARHGARMVFVANRRRERAAVLARRLGGRAVGFECVRAELTEADLVFTCTASPDQVVARGDVVLVMEQRLGRPLLLIDTAVPRDIDPAVRDLPNVALYDIDDLKREVSGDAAVRATGTDRAARVIDREVARFAAWLASLDVVPAISVLHQHAEMAVEQVLKEHEPLWETLSEEDRRRVALVAHTVVNRLLHEPTLRLKRMPGNEISRTLIQALRDLFGFDSRAPEAGTPGRSRVATQHGGGVLADTGAEPVEVGGRRVSG